MVSLWVRIFIVLFKLQFIKVLSAQNINPGSGVNYYGNVQRNSFLTPLKDTAGSFKPRDCTKAPPNTTCIEDPFFNDPNVACQLVEPVLCNPTYPYRHFDGKCNHLTIPKMGISRECFLRFIAPEFDGYGDARKASSGGPLPEPRLISQRILKNQTILDENVSFQLVVFGQVVAHDMSRAIKASKPDCCAPENSNISDCWPIKISQNDPYYSKLNKTCIDFHRTEECKFCPTATRAQTNGATAAMDASWLYGENEEKAKKLRAFNGKGELKYDPNDPKAHLPIVGVDKEDEFCYSGQESECLLTGDPRVNMHANLGGSEAVWLREHNRIAKKLRQMNPNWEEEKIFQESRKILIAEFQCITYKHFLPIILSGRVMKEFGIFIEDGSVGTTYDLTVILAVWNEFAVAAYRLHSLIPSDIGYGNLQFRDTFSNPDLIRDGYTTDILRGSFHVPVEKYDNYVVDDVTKYLYNKLQDLASINIQRGRDHGLAPYVEAIVFCSGHSLKVENFDDLWKLGLMTRRKARILNRTYQNVRDIDMWVGMQMENRMNGSILGPTAVCIIAKQMFFTMHGDRFFFYHQGQTPSFTKDQRVELKKCSLARVLCDNTNIRNITRNPFFLPSEQNPEASCKGIPRINLTLWKESMNVQNMKTSEISPPVSNDTNMPAALSV